MWTSFRPTSGTRTSRSGGGVSWPGRDHRDGSGTPRPGQDRRDGSGTPRPRQGAPLPALALLAVAAAAGCNYSFTAGAGLPPHIRTVAIVPLENSTNRFELTQELHEALLRQLPRALGLTLAGEESADAIVSGTIEGYELQAPLYQRGQQTQTVQVLQRQVVLRLQARILDRENYTILWEQQLRCMGQYLEASETEEVGRAEAIELCVQEIVDGAQSNW